MNWLVRIKAWYYRYNYSPNVATWCARYYKAYEIASILLGKQYWYLTYSSLLNCNWMQILVNIYMYMLNYQYNRWLQMWNNFCLFKIWIYLNFKCISKEKKREIYIYLSLNYIPVIDALINSFRILQNIKKL